MKRQVSSAGQLALLLVSLSCAARAEPSQQAGSSGPLAQAAPDQAELNGQNVILIKYANTSSANNGAFRLFNEPLSVSVIESKFSSSIQSFDVSSNKLATLPKDLFCPLSNEVRQLNISNNRLENFDCLGLISQAGQLCLSELKLLDMSHNLIKHLPATGVATLHNLEQLDLSHNLIDSLDELSLSSLFKLTKLDLSFNRIQHLPVRIFHKSSSLKVLSMQFNLLQTPITPMFLSGLIALEELNMSFNNITHIADLAFLDKLNLTRVDLRHNRLSNLKQQAIELTFIPPQTAYANRYPYTHTQTTATSGSTLRSPLQTTSSSSSSPVTTTTTRHRLHHNGQYASPPTTLSSGPMAAVAAAAAASPAYSSRAHQQPYVHGLVPLTNTEFLFSLNPFVCDCQLDWLRRHQPPNAIKRSVLSSSNANLNQRFQQAGSSDFYHQSGTQMSLMSSASSSNGNNLANSNSFYQNDQPPVIAAAASLPSAENGLSAAATNNNISEIISNSADVNSNYNKYSNSGSLSASNSQSQSAQQHHFYGRIADLDLIKCSPLFRRNSQRSHHRHQHHHQQHKVSPQMPPSSNIHSQSKSPVAPSDDNKSVHHPSDHKNFAALYRQHAIDNPTMIDLLTADSSNFLCRYKSHCFALCHCCEFDACDCEMICPNGCNCYYDSTWQTNIIDCSSMDHTVVPDRIPMDVSGLYLDGNNIESLKPSNLIARKSLKTLYLNATQLHYIANRTFNGLIELQTLYLNDNMLKTLNGHEFEPLAQLKALYLQSNRLDHINNQTFIYLRSLEILDLSDNRLTSVNLDLFWSIGHHNIRLRQLSIAHNWWSCQCNSINRFRHVLKQKFLINGNSVQIMDRNQLRCYFNSTTVGPLILASGASGPTEISSISGFMQSPTTGGYKQNQQQQYQLTEINQCSDNIEDETYSGDLNPPLIQPVNDYTPAPPTVNDLASDPYFNQDPSGSSNQAPILDQPIYVPPNSILQTDNSNLNNILNTPLGVNPSFGISSTGQRLDSTRSSMPMTTFILLSILLAGITVIGVSIFIFVRQQKQRFHQKESTRGSPPVSAPCSTTYGYTPNLYSSTYQQRDWSDQRGDRAKPPKVKQFVSKLVNKSLAFGGYRTCSRDELSAITSDKIYDAFISYDKRDESFVVQHLSAELEYGQPHYR